MRLAAIAAGLAIGCLACGGAESDSGESPTAGSGGVTTGGAGGVLPGGTGGGGAATGGNGGASGGGPPTDLNPTAACIYYVQRRCERGVQCGAFYDVDSCRRGADTLCPDLFFSDGSTRTPERLIGCAEEWQNVSCYDLYANVDPTCVTPGTRALGEACIDGSQCASGRCATGGSGECGTCVDVVGEGERCSNQLGPVCAGGLYCDSGASDACVVYPTDFTPTYLREGEPCPAGYGCVEGYACEEGPAGGPLTCQPLPARGQPCPEADCAPDSYCGSSGTCEPLPVVGEPCGQEADEGRPNYCAEDAYCERTTSPPQCMALPLAGQPCTAALSCAPGLSCECIDSSCTAHVCADLRRPGEPCDATSTCYPAGTCEGGVCSAGEMQGLFEAACGP